MRSLHPVLSQHLYLSRYLCLMFPSLMPHSNAHSSSIIIFRFSADLPLECLPFISAHFTSVFKPAALSLWSCSAPQRALVISQQPVDTHTHTQFTIQLFWAALNQHFKNQGLTTSLQECPVEKQLRRKVKTTFKFLFCIFPQVTVELKQETRTRPNKVSRHSNAAT